MSITTQHDTMSARMRAARRFAGIEQAEMAEAVGRDRTAISKYENGHTEIPASVLVRWAEATGASLNWLAWGEESRPRESNPRPSHYKRHTLPAESAMFAAFVLVRKLTSSRTETP